MMLDKKDIQKIKQKLNDYNAQREIMVKKARDILKLSKRIIYSVHRNELSEAENSVAEIKEKINDINNEIKNHLGLFYTGAYKVAVQEYVEALLFFSYVKDKKILTSEELNVAEEYYLLGLIDLIGELFRLAVNSVIKEDYATTVEIKELVSEIYYELMQFDFASGELRRKFDSIKYDLNKLESLVLELKLKGKI